MTPAPQRPYALPTRHQVAERRYWIAQMHAQELRSTCQTHRDNGRADLADVLRPDLLHAETALAAAQRSRTL